MRPVLYALLFCGLAAEEKLAAQTHLSEAHSAELAQIDAEVKTAERDKKEGRLTLLEFKEFAERQLPILQTAYGRTVPLPRDTMLYAGILNRLEFRTLATAALNDSLTENPDNANLSLALGHSYLEKSDYAAGLAQAQAILKREPLNKAALALKYQCEGRASASLGKKLPDTAQSRESQSHEPQSVSLGEDRRQQLRASSPRPAVPVPSPSSSVRDQVNPALGYLRLSEQGREIDDFLIKHQIPFVYAQMGPNAAAAYSEEARAILLPSNAASLPPVELAVIIGHEGFHARQDIERDMESSIEIEQEASYRDRIIHHEMLRAGAPRLPKNHPLEMDYRRFDKQVEKQKFKEFNDDIAARYSKNREPVLQAAVKVFRPGIRPAIRYLAELLDAPPLYDMETLAYQKGKVANARRWWFLEKTRKAHAIEQAWELKWMKEHQSEFMGPP